jgi:hypothetical protein
MIMVKNELIECYGPLMTIGDIAEVLHYTKGAVYNKFSQKTLGIKTFKVGGKRFAETSDVADFIDKAKLLNS